jgi:hypothetical protein
VVSLIMARVPEGTRRFRLPSPRVQPAETRGALKPCSCKNAAACSNQTAHSKTQLMQKKLPCYQTVPLVNWFMFLCCARRCSWLASQQAASGRDGCAPVPMSTALVTLVKRQDALVVAG